MCFISLENRYICTFTYLRAYLSIYLSIYPSIYLSIYVSVELIYPPSIFYRAFYLAAGA